MLSQKAIKGLGLRFGWSGLQTPYRWDRKSLQVIPANFYLRANCYMMIPSGFFFCLLLFLYFYDKITSTEDLTGKEYATIILLWGEVILAGTVTLLTIVVLRNQREMAYLFNQLIRYNNSVIETREKSGVPQDAHYKKKMREGDVMAMLASTVCTYVAPSIGVTALCPIEPLGVIFKEWLEIKLKAEAIFLPFFVGMSAGLYSFVNIVYFIGAIMVFYHNIATTMVPEITPQQVVSIQRQGRCHVRTKVYSEIEDAQIIQCYRTLQMFNVLVHKFMATVLVSVHHVASLSTAVVLIYFGIQYQDTIAPYGILAFVVLAGMILAPFLLIYLESAFCGELVNASQAFKNAGQKILGRKTMLRKFARSCGVLNIPYAYPFYAINKNTVLEFTEQVVDYSIELLLL